MQARALGLSICREIMRLLDGEVTAANSAKGGAVFTLRFPDCKYFHRIGLYDRRRRLEDCGR